MVMSAGCARQPAKRNKNKRARNCEEPEQTMKGRSTEAHNTNRHGLKRGHRQLHDGPSDAESY
ncbi:hypothetical protein DQG23_17710 [Paenibacillus contaminans]|uniref:Uncharacterized protein n=1 Tax=Paenibacillus contaminans TaxID=450362 RepID=A0A329MJG6_9BACL|nr:hypothetical protein DQG23_17710 [Paenibacillus contaminans]